MKINKTITSRATYFLAYIMQQLQKIAKKLNLDKPTYKIERFENDKGQKLANVEINFPVELKIGDFQTIAVIEDFDVKGYLIKKVDFTAEIKNFVVGLCEHCHTDRKRNKYYIVSDGKTQLQVGSTCLKDFIGHPDALKVMQLIEMLADNEGMTDDEFFGGKREAKTYEKNEVLAYAIATIEKLGFTKANDFDNLSTKEVVLTNIIPDFYNNEFLLKNPQYQIEIEQSHFDKAKELLTWIENNEQSNDYINNLKVVSRFDFIEVKMFGLLVSLPQAKINSDNFEKRKTEREETQKKLAETNKSDYVGTVKERKDFTGTLTSKRFFESDFGGSYMVVFDCEENVVVGYVSASAKASNIISETQTGQTLKFKATIKAHTEFRGVKQTKVNRLAI